MPILNRGSVICAYIFLINSIFIASPSSGSSSDLNAEQQLDRVLNLPGQNFDVSFAHYSGYILVDEESVRELFYWFFEAAEDPLSKPVVLWLQGGPGCSSIGYGMAEEIGPFHIEKDGKTLYLNPYSWNQVANVLFLESPVGTGFSYSNLSSDVLNNGDKRTASDSLAFFLRWFERFPQFKGNDFYITGESYAGHYIPQLSQAIMRYNLNRSEKAINLKGYMVGNALTDAYNDHLGVFEYMWASGLISDQTYKQLNMFCHFQPFLHLSEQCDSLLDIVSEELGDIDIYSVFTPTCTAQFGLSSHLLKRRRTRIGETYDPCTLNHSAVYFNLPDVQKALHVDPRKAPPQWQTCNRVIFNNWKDSATSVLDIYRELINSVRIWVFSGDTDTVIPVTSTRYSINALNLSTVSHWRAWYDDGQVAGWTQEYEGLTFVTVRGAGHEVPKFRPKQALTLFISFLSGSSMPGFEKLSDI